MKQSKINIAFSATEELIKQSDLSISGKWILFKVRKELSVHMDFFKDEMNKLLEEFHPSFENNMLKFESADKRIEFEKRQKELENFEIKTVFTKETLKLSDIPGITVPQMEMLQDFIEFNPE